jgi:rubrerythrin
MIIKNLVNSFKKAEIIENARAKTYKQYYNKVSFAAGRDVLDFLYKAELNHLKFLEIQEKRLLKGKKVDDSEIKDKPFKPQRRFLFKGLNNLDSDIIILESAAKLEKSDVAFYKEQMQKAKDANAKNFFDKMANLEYSHLNLLKKTINNARNEGFSLGSLDPRVLFTKVLKGKSKKGL